MMKISFATPAKIKDGTLVVGVSGDLTLSPPAAALDAATEGHLSRAIAANPRFKGKPEQTLAVLAPETLGFGRVLLIGTGDAQKATDLSTQRLGGAIYAALEGLAEKKASVHLDLGDGAALAPEAVAANVAYGATLRSYRFDLYRSNMKPEQLPKLEKLVMAVESTAPAKRLFAKLDAVASGVAMTRDLVSEPANILYPAEFVKRVKALTELGIEVEILDEKKMTKLGMGSLLGVGQGSARESFIAIMKWNGGRAKEAPVAFVGKGVCFDSGGISLKPGAGMWDMKWDMGGAGVVTGLMKALAGRKAKVNAVGLIGLVENMPSGTAQRPGDIVTAMNGTTIEVLNTDAEGRLVLADALWYTRETYKPKFMVDLATLTGACMVALGSHNAGLFSNNDELADMLLTSAKSTGEGLWRLPLDDAYDREIDGDMADIKNIAGTRFGGAIHAAQFLQRFVGDTKWAHMDIAGVTWSGKDTPLAPKGGTGYGVRMLDRFVADCLE